MEFNQFVNEELKRVITDKSNSGSTRWIDFVYEDDPDPRSAGSSILLRDKLKQEEFESLMKLAGEYLPEYTIKYFQKHPEKKNKIEKFLVTMNNLQFLKDELKRTGELRCTYCNKGPLVIYDINPKEVTTDMLLDPNIKISKFNRRDGATCDHMQPQSRGGSKFDYSNLTVACEPCNKRKSNKSWERWLEYMKERDFYYTKTH